MGIGDTGIIAYRRASTTYDMSNRFIPSTTKKLQETSLNCYIIYGHVLRREEEYVGKRVVVMDVPGKKEEKTKAKVVG